MGQRDMWSQGYKQHCWYLHVCKVTVRRDTSGIQLDLRYYLVVFKLGQTSAQSRVSNSCKVFLQNLLYVCDHDLVDELLWVCC